MATLKCLVTLLTCFILTWQTEPKEISKNILNYLSIRNGLWSNRNQTKGNNSVQQVIEARYIPVKVPALGEVPALFMERVVDGKNTILVLTVLTEDASNTVYLKAYEIKDFNKYKPLSLNATHLSAMIATDFEAGHDCPGVYEAVGSRVFSGQYSLCGREAADANGTRPLYSVTHGCDKLFFVVPEGDREKLAPTYYVLHPEGDRFPVPDAPEDYVSPCNTEEQ